MSDGLFLPIYTPRGMRSSTFLWGLINSCNKYVSSLWLMWVHGLYAFSPFRNLQPLRYHALPFLTLRRGANFTGASKPHDMIRSITHKPYYIFLKTATIPTYYGFSMAIPRYIAMQLPLLLFDDLSIHCHIALHDHIADIVFVAQPPFIIFHTCYTRSLHILVHCQRHSYRVIFCHRYRVVIFISFEL